MLKSNTVILVWYKCIFMALVQMYNDCVLVKDFSSECVGFIPPPSPPYNRIHCFVFTEFIHVVFSLAESQIFEFLPILVLSCISNVAPKAKILNILFDCEALIIFSFTAPFNNMWTLKFKIHPIVTIPPAGTVHFSLPSISEPLRIQK